MKKGFPIRLLPLVAAAVLISGLVRPVQVQATNPAPGQKSSGQEAMCVPGEILVKLRKGSRSAAAFEKTRSGPGKTLEAVGATGSLFELLKKHKASEVKSAFRVAGLSQAVKPKDGLGKHALEASKASRQELFRWYKVAVPTNADLAKIVAELKASEEVEAAEVNGTVRLAQIQPPITGLPDSTTDPGIPQQWHFALTKAYQAWGFLKQKGYPPGGSRDIVVAVIDSGVDAQHQDLVGNMWVNSGEIPGNGVDDDQNGFVDDLHGCCVVSDARNHSGDSSDVHGHGTHVSGIVAASAFNHVGGVGMAFNVQIMSIRAAQYSGIMSFADITEAVLYALDNGAEVINMSFGGYGRSQLLEDAFEVGLNQAMLVAAAGNNGGAQMYPASLPFVIGVGSCGGTGRRSGFSCSGDIYAPGESIYSTLPGNQYAQWSGTSMAAPVISGIAALLRSYYWQRDIYSTRFLMGALYYSGYDAYNALTVLPPPDLVVNRTWLFDNKGIGPANDGDGRVDSGETLHLAVELINHSGRADNAVATLTARAPGATMDDPYVQITAGTTHFPTLDPWNRGDNGLIYQAGVITGVQNPLVFTISPDCPNEHVIFFNLTVSYQDGWDPKHPTHVAALEFQFSVQRGRNLPGVISANMTLTPDQYWIVGSSVLVEPQATLTIEPGTQLQWGAVSSDPYNPGPQAGSVLVRGALIARGNATNPISMFPTYSVAGQTVAISTDSGGVADLTYANVLNPSLRGFRSIDHTRFSWDGFASEVDAINIENTTFHKFRGGGRIRAEAFTRCLFDAGWMVPEGSVFRDCVFIQDIENNRPLSFSVPSGFTRNLTCEGAAPPRFVSPFTTNSETFVVLPMERGDWRLAETVAKYYGGHLASIRSQGEWDMIQPWLNTVGGLAGGTTRYFAGLVDDGHAGQLAWTDGSPLTFTAWLPGQPNVPFFQTRQTQVYAAEDWGGRTSGWIPMPIAWASRDGSQLYWWNAFVLRLPGANNLQQLTTPFTNGVMLEYVKTNFPGAWRFNAFLNKYWDPVVGNWMRFFPSSSDPNAFCQMKDTFWGTENTNLINYAIVDYYDNYKTPRMLYGTPPAHGYESTYPFVENVWLNGAPMISVPQVEAGPAVFRVAFNRDMNTNIEPFVTFGPSPPHTDFRLKPRDADFVEMTNGWLNARTWEGKTWITPVTGNGYHLMRISDAVDAHDPWLVSGYDVGRFEFKVQTVGVMSMTLQADGREGGVELTWQQNDYELLAGYNLYRASAIDGEFVKLNPTVIPPGSERYLDTAVTPAVPMFYKFTVVTTGFEESAPSEIVSATAFDTIPPVLTHAPVTAATPGRQLRVVATATDNVAVRSALVYYRPATGETNYMSLTMLNASGNEWAATVPASAVQPPGLEYYLVVSDGISQAYSGTAATPHYTLIDNQPTLASVTPGRGPAAGGTPVTLGGLQFEPGLSVLFGGVLASNIVVLSANQVSCVTPPHFPATVEVKVINTNQTQSTLLNGFTFEAVGTLVSLPVTTGDYGATVEVPVAVANVTGLRAADLTVVYDATVLRAQSARLGPLTAGWGMTANWSTSGRIVISMASATAVSGSGVVVYLSFDVVGAPPASSALGFESALLNDGAIVHEASAGQFIVNGFWQLSGTVRYFQDARPLSGVSLGLVGVGPHHTVSDTNGAFVITNLPTGSYTLTPAKTDEVRDITSFDASLTLRSAAGLLTLSPEQRVAADVNRNGAVSSMDASYILEKTVGLIEVPFPNAGRVWDFVPEARAYPALNSDQTAQDFVAILLGDVSGNWSSTSEAGLAGAERLAVGLDTGMVRSNRDVTRVIFKVTSGAPLIFGVDLGLVYNSRTASIQAIELGADADGCLLAFNTNLPGTVSLALASSKPLPAEGCLVSLALSNAASSDLHVSRISINEGTITGEITNGASIFDSDSDRVWDIDEVALYHTDPAQPDSDRDGLNDGQELQAGTDPNDPTSNLRLIPSAPDEAGNVPLVWTAVPGRKYQIESAECLPTSVWSVFGPSFQATDPTMRILLVPEETAKTRFFRVRLVSDM